MAGRSHSAWRPGPHGAVQRVFSAGLWIRLIAFAALTACAGYGGRGTIEIDHGRVESLDHLMGALVAADPVHVVPAPQWTAEGEPAVWKVEGMVSLVCHVASGSEGRLVISLVPDEPTSRLHFRATWDDEPLLADTLALDDGAFSLEIPADRLGQGTHLLALRRDFASDAVADRSIRTSTFSEVRVSDGQRSWTVDAGDAERLQLMSRFLLYRVTGSTMQRLGGCLVEGRASIRQQLQLASDARIELVVESLGTGHAGVEVEVEVDGTSTRSTLKPGAQLPITIPVATGIHELELRTLGTDRDLVLWGSPFIAVPSGPQGPPPIILVTMDTTRRDALAPFGGPPAASEAITQLAEHAAVFTNAHATAPWTLPSHASMLTGLYPIHHLAGVLRDHLVAAHQTLADVLSAHGYYAAGLAGGELCASRWGLGQGFHRYRDPDGFETRGDRQIDEALAVLHDHAQEPLLLFVNLFDPHAMYDAPAAYQELFDVPALRAHLDHLPLWRAFADGNAGAWARIIDHEAPADEQALAYVRAAYLAEVAFMDAQIGRLLDGLREAGIYDRALIVLVGDHGELLGEQGYFSHGCRLDPELTEVPLIIKWPGQHSGTRIDRLVSQVDLYETVLEVAGIDRGGSSPGTGDGISLVGAGSTGEAQGLVSREHVLMEEHELNIHPLYPSMKIAPHLFGVQRTRSREVAYKGGITCSELGPAGWHEVGCEVSWQDLLALFADVGTVPLAPDGSMPDDTGEAGALSHEDTARLRALGYLR